MCVHASIVRPLSSFCWLVRILRSSLSQAIFTSTVGAWDAPGNTINTSPEYQNRNISAISLQNTFSLNHQLLSLNVWFHPRTKHKFLFYFTVTQITMKNLHKLQLYSYIKLKLFQMFALLTWTTYTSSLPLYQISNFFTSPLTFSVIPTAVICQDTHTHTASLTSCNTSVPTHAGTPPLRGFILPASSIINQEQRQLLLRRRWCDDARRNSRGEKSCRSAASRALHCRARLGVVHHLQVIASCQGRDVSSIQMCSAEGCRVCQNVLPKEGGRLKWW